MNVYPSTSTTKQALPKARRVTYEDLPLSKLQKSPGNKRGLNEVRARKLAEHFDNYLAGTIHVSHRDDAYYVIDGWHRVKAAIMAGRRTLICCVREGYSLADEARAFDILNTARTRITSGDEFWARIDYGEPFATDVLTTCRALGITVQQTGPAGISQGGPTPTSTRAYSALQRIRMAYGHDVLTETLRVCRSAWPGDERALAGWTIQLVGNFIALYRTHPAYRERRLGEVLGRMGTQTLIQRMRAAQGLRGVASERTTGKTAFGSPSERAVMVAIYNLGVRTDANRLPELTQSEIVGASKHGGRPWKEVK